MRAMSRLLCLLVIVSALQAAECWHRRSRAACPVSAQTEAGRVCGLRRVYAPRGTDAAVEYASFRGVPYAKQPLGELRFKELQPLEKWSGDFNASVEGPVCPQHDVLYGPLMQPHGQAEDCIRANVHVPLRALPGRAPPAPRAPPQPPRSLADASSASSEEAGSALLPVLVFIHGGGFAVGSGDTDFNGPEYLISHNLVVITFNYRLGPLGFLSLNSSSVPGNAGLRDCVTLLRWVRRNARAFGGDPARVTLAGQSAGAVAAHLLTLSDVAEGLFHRAILMSGAASRTFITPSPIYADYVAKVYLKLLGVTATDPEQIHAELVKMPIEQLMDANRLIQDEFGIGAFYPTIESRHAGVTAVLTEDPEALLAAGRGKHVPLVIGFVADEGLVFKPRFETIDIVSRLRKNPMLMVPPYLLFTATPEQQKQMLRKVAQRYIAGAVTVDEFTRYAGEAMFEYPALHAAAQRANTPDAAKAYLYQFAYRGQFRVVESAAQRSFGSAGATHTEDLTYVLKVNSIPEPAPRAGAPPRTEDHEMQHWMTTLIANFIKCGNPTGGRYELWPPVSAAAGLEYQDIRRPFVLDMSRPTDAQAHMLELYDDLYQTVVKP